VFVGRADELAVRLPVSRLTATVQCDASAGHGTALRYGPSVMATVAMRALFVGFTAQPELLRPAPGP
jgi:hypothetical protein